MTDILNLADYTEIEMGVVEKTYVRECLTIYVRENIANRMLTKYNFLDNIEDLFLELNVRKRKWLLRGMYHPPSQPDQYFFNTLDKALDVYSNYENVLLIGDFIVQIEARHLDTFYINMS